MQILFYPSLSILFVQTDQIPRPYIAESAFLPRVFASLMGDVLYFIPRYGQAKVATASPWRRKTGCPSSNLWKKALQLRWECIHTHTHTVKMLLIGLTKHSHALNLVPLTTTSVLRRHENLQIHPSATVQQNEIVARESLSATL